MQPGPEGRAGSIRRCWWHRPTHSPAPSGGPTCSSWRCCRAAAPCPRSRRCSRTGSRLHRTCRRAPGIYPGKAEPGGGKGEDQDLRSVPELAHAESLEMPTLGASQAAPKARGKQRGQHAEGQPHGGYGVQNEFPTPSHPNGAAGAPHPLRSLALSPGTAPLTLHVWHRPPSNSGWKVAGFLLPQDRQLSERQRAPLTQGSGCSSPPGAQGTTRSAHPAQDLRLWSRAGNARSLLRPAVSRSWPSCGSPREDRSSLSMKTSRGPWICSTTPVSVRCISGGTARFCLVLPSGTHTPRPLTKTGQASDYLRGSRCCS